MASINGKDVVIQFSTDSGTTWKNMVCETESGVNMKTETTSTQTKCDGGATITSAGAKSWTMTGSGVVETAPESTEVSYEDLLGWWSASTALQAKIASGTDFIHKGDVWITELDLKLPTDGNANFTITLTGNGTLAIA